MGLRPGGAGVYEFFLDNTGVEALFVRLNTAVSPIAIAEFLRGTVSPYLQARAERRFEIMGDDVSGAWLPLAPATQAIRENLGYGADRPINVRTGELKDYITGTPLVKELGLGAELTMPGVPATGQLADKVETAQIGKDNPRTPARPVIGLNEQDLSAVLMDLGGFYAKALGMP